MPTSMIIVDDFLENPMEYRKAAMQLTFPEDQGNVGYPGKNSANRLMVEGLDQAVSGIVGERLKPNVRAGHGRARITLAGDDGQAGVHIDPCHWSAILYLSLPEHCEGGTDFFVHKETGTERALLEPEDMQRLGVRTKEEANALFNRILTEDGLKPEKWERTMRVPMRFNRLLLLRPWLWHTATPGFGSSLEDGRLIQILFYDRG